MMVSFDNKIPPQIDRASTFEWPLSKHRAHFHKSTKVSFCLFKACLRKEIGVPYCINTAHISLPEASHLMIKGLKKSGKTKQEVGLELHLIFLKVSTTFSSQIKLFFFNNTIINYYAPIIFL